MARAVIYVDGPLRPAEHYGVGRQTKLQACRAYCARMGYEVANVVTAAKPKPSVSGEALGVYDRDGLDALRAFLAAQPHHPEDDADAMLESGAVDVMVVFTPIGDSGPFDWNYSPEMREHLPPPPRVERASLWEIEPPTPEQRQHHYWTMEDMARHARGERTRAVVYVRVAAYPPWRAMRDEQERFCRGYCAREDYEVAEVYRDTIPRPGDRDGEGVEQPNLHLAVAAVQAGHAHLLVALKEDVLAADAEGLSALQAQVTRIEYAKSYAAEVQARGLLEVMQRVQAVFEQIIGAREASGTPGEPPAHNPALAPANAQAARPMDTDDGFATFPDLETPGLRLRRPLPDDAQAIRAAYTHAVAAYHTPLTPHSSPAELVALLEMYRGSFEEHTAIYWAVVRKPGDKPLGICGLVNFERAARRGLLTFIVSRTRWRQGLMNDAVRAVIAFGFDRLGLHRIEAVVVDGDGDGEGDDNNALARSLLTKLGFAPEGRLRERYFIDGKPLDEHRFGLLRADYRRERTR